MLHGKGDGGGKSGFKGSGKPQKVGEKGAGQKGGDRKPVVRRSMRDNGTCAYGDACRHNHDKNLIAEEKRKLEAGGGGQQALALESKRDGKKDKGKDNPKGERKRKGGL